MTWRGFWLLFLFVFLGLAIIASVLDIAFETKRFIRIANYSFGIFIGFALFGVNSPLRKMLDKWSEK